jgi:competence protein ComEC
MIMLPLAAVLWLPYMLSRSWQRLLSGVLLIGCSWFGACAHFEHSELPEKGIEGALYFSISQVKPSQTPFGQVLSYQGKASGFLSSEKKRLAKVPVQILMKESKTRPLADCDYLIHGRLYKSRKGTFVFKPSRHVSWQPVANTHSFAEWRLQFKRKIGNYIKEQFGKAPCSTLFTSLATGDIDDRTLAIEFSRLGLSHILAISGFHFALFASFIVFCLGLFLPFRATQIASLSLVAAYLFFLGPCPSAMRAWCAISIALTGRISGLRSSGMNALGAGLAIILIYDPALCKNLGFQLSFLCTAALLLLFQPCEKLLMLFFPARKTSAVKTMSLLDQHGTLLAALVRKSLALTLAVHIATLPVCLFYFSSFPLVGSLLYNLFFPFLLSLSLFLLLTGVAISPLLPFLGRFIHNLNQDFTDFLLDTVTHAPPAVKAAVSVGPIHPFFVVAWLSLLLIFSIFWSNQSKTI